MKNIVFTLLVLSSHLAANTKYTSGSKKCPQADELNNYINVPLFHNLKNIATTENIQNLDLHTEQQQDYQDFELEIYFELYQKFDPKKKLLLLIPGGPGNDHQMLHDYAVMMKKNTSILEQYNVISMDHRGLGCSRPLFPGAEPDKALMMRHAASDIDLIRKFLVGESGKITLFGESYGTFLAQTYALLYPDKTDKLFLSAALSSYKDFENAQRKYETLAISSIPGLYERYDRLKQEFPNYAKKFIEWTVFPFYDYSGRTQTIPTQFAKLESALQLAQYELADELVTQTPWVMEKLMRSIVCMEIYKYSDDPTQFHMFPENFSHCKEYQGNFDYFDYTNDLKNITAPTFLWSGFYDHVTPTEGMSQIAKLIPDNFLYVDPHLGHMITQKEECFLSLFEGFLAGDSSQGLKVKTLQSACQQPPKSDE